LNTSNHVNHVNCVIQVNSPEASTKNALQKKVYSQYLVLQTYTRV